MPQSTLGAPLTVGFGLRAFKGGAVVVAVAMVDGEPRVILSTTLDTHAEGDRLSFEPYRVAAEMPRGPEGRVAPDVAAIVAEGHRRQEQLATDGLQSIIRRLEAEGCKAVLAALLVNRAGWIADLLEYSLAWAEHVPVAENLAVRDALRFAVRQCGVELVELDEKSLTDVASQALDVASTVMEARLKALGSSAGKPWRKEQKLACLGAWMALVGHRAVETGRPDSSHQGAPQPGREQ